MTAVSKALVKDEFSIAAAVRAVVIWGMLPLISLYARTTSLSQRACSAPYTTWATSTDITSLSASPSVCWLLDDSVQVIEFNSSHTQQVYEDFTHHHIPMYVYRKS